MEHWMLYQAKRRGGRNYFTYTIQMKVCHVYNPDFLYLFPFSSKIMKRIPIFYILIQKCNWLKDGSNA